MPGYLDEYGAAEQKHARNIKRVKWSALILVVAAILGYAVFSILQTRSEEQQVQTFVGLLKNKNYQAAYRMWGCTETNPCRDYSFQRFMEDWGPGSSHANAAGARVESGDTCGTGVVVPVHFQGAEQVPLWVEKATEVIGFAPDPECRKRRWHIREFFHSLFSRQS